MMKKILSHKEYDIRSNLPDGLNVTQFKYFGEGNFKKVYPISHLGMEIAPESARFAVSFCKNIGTKLDVMLRNEHDMLLTLRSQAVPVIDVYGETQVKVGDTTRNGLLIQWIPLASLIEAKTPGLTKLVIEAVAKGVRVPQAENPFIFSRIRNEIIAMPIKQNIAQTMLEDLTKIFSSSQIIVDLQILIDPTGHCFVIDPMELISREHVREGGSDFQHSMREMAQWQKETLQYLRQLLSH